MQRCHVISFGIERFSVHEMNVLEKSRTLIMIIILYKMSTSQYVIYE